MLQSSEHQNLEIHAVDRASENKHQRPKGLCTHTALQNDVRDCHTFEMLSVVMASIFRHNAAVLSRKRERTRLTKAGE